MSNTKRFSSRKEVSEFLKEKGIDTSNWSEEKWLKLNKGQAEIHMMTLAESIYDAMNESTPNNLKAGEWHIPFEDKIPLFDKKNPDEEGLYWTIKAQEPAGRYSMPDDLSKREKEYKVKISTAMAAHTSYTTVGNEPVKSYKKWIELHDKLIAYDPPHSSPMEHCARAMSNDEYYQFFKGKITDPKYYNGNGWCYNLKGFIPYRYLIDNKIDMLNK